MRQVLVVTYHMSPVTCPLSNVACYLSIMPTATDPPPANSPTMDSKKAGLQQKKRENKKLSRKKH